MSAKTIQIEEIKALQTADEILVRNILTYFNTPTTADLLTTDIPAWGNVIGLLTGVSTIPVWVSGSYPQSSPVIKEIGSIWYLFISQVDNNTSTPSLSPSIVPWAIGSNQYAGGWSSSYPYLLDDVVLQSGHLYISLIGSNTGHDPVSSPDYWKDLGVNRGNFNPDYEGGYADDDAVFYDGYSYSSNVSANTFLPTDPGTNAWYLIGDNPTLEPNTPKEINVGYNTQLDGDADSGWYYTIPFAEYSAYGHYPDIRIYRDSNARINLDYVNTLSDNITVPLPDVDDDGKTLYPYLIIITK